MEYHVVYADPPWQYRNKKTGGSMASGASQKYPTMPTIELCSLPIAEIVAKDAVLFLWATVPMLPDALAVMESWGFKYKGLIVWRKIMSLGLGFWLRGQIELLLFGIRGKVRAFRSQKPNFIQARVGKHSEKPETFRELIEELTQGMEPRLELFATKATPGWDCWGLELNGIDVRTMLEGRDVRVKAS
jgi:site-specific DNA-methyltransferase (adenine-specific)